ncbi:UDP-3-O-(3-hydroxymyristoyl)glucosamine N-acyltransferase [Winogradskyella psychrotolerans]|uniref:UDP-3-O-(3-hydroxymyristoyl)glucosamine N-acyltransferase n=1 Tax=Winogradskyella psychrotolerans TaxID=1344585 RepID=UPI001C07ECE5|nr:UDP-3-O-(3-hydroxymyristoyl)glucosamine N-acyltransferase [Winogradskyella psychrotolerans]MBU2928381.1 UDP-3-O-(3-hydroxymyristoyl)glucosamine N-acyltransferase [Winogradskyella psychrotolerans]
MKFTAEKIADILEGTVVGDPNIEVFKLSKIEEGTQGSLTFLSNLKYTHHIYTTEASITIVNSSFEPEKPISTTLIKVEDAYEGFSKLMEYYDRIKSFKLGIEQPSFIAETVKVPDSAYIGAFAYIGNNVTLGENVKIHPNAYVGDNVSIGDDTTIYPGGKVYSDCIIGKRCVINSGVIVGADGFGFAPNKNGSYSKIPQIGNVILEDEVDIGAGTTIDRATMGSTILRFGVKLDNQIQIAHNVEIGKNTVIAAQSGVAGSTKIGEHCQIGGQVGIAGHLVIGNNVKVQAQSGIGRNVKDNEVLQGSPSFGYTDWNKSYVYFKNLPKLAKTINELEKKVDGNN